MRMDDNLRPLGPAQPGPAEAAAVAAAVQAPKRTVRFTSNVVGSLFFVTDLICFCLSAPIALGVYALLRGARFNVPVHFTAFLLMVGSFLLIRTSRQAYRRSLLDLRDSSDTTFDAVISSLIASALIWLAGLIHDYSRGITLIFTITAVLLDRKSTRLNSSHSSISYAVFCLKKKKIT